MGQMGRMGRVAIELGYFVPLLIRWRSVRFLDTVGYCMNVMFGLFNLGGGEIILVLALVLILFGAKKLPELAKGLGQGIKEFKKATREVNDEFQNSVAETPPPPQRNLPANPAPNPKPGEPQQTVPQSTPGTKA